MTIYCESCGEKISSKSDLNIESWSLDEGTQGIFRKLIRVVHAPKLDSKKPRLCRCSLNGLMKNPFAKEFDSSSPCPSEISGEDLLHEEFFQATLEASPNDKFGNKRLKKIREAAQKTFPK